MTLSAVRGALETALNAVAGSIPTAFENSSYPPTKGTAYQRCTVLFAEPDESETGRVHNVQGYMQVDLMYPEQVGWGVATVRAQTLKDAFPRGTTLTGAGGVKVLISSVPAVDPGRNDGDRYIIPVRIKFRAQVSG